MAAPQPGVHRHLHTVRFGDCDPAGIVYFPRFFDLFHQAMESWFGRHLGVAYDEVVQGRKVGFPAVHTEADFARPCAFGDALVIELRVGKIGRSSLELLYAIRGEQDDTGGPARVRGRTVVTAFDLDPESPTYRRALAMPEDLRAAIEAFVAGKDEGSAP